MTTRKVKVVATTLALSLALCGCGVKSDGDPGIPNSSQAQQAQAPQGAGSSGTTNGVSGEHSAKDADFKALVGDIVNSKDLESVGKEFDAFVKKYGGSYTKDDIKQGIDAWIGRNEKKSKTIRKDFKKKINQFKKSLDKSVAKKDGASVFFDGANEVVSEK